MNNNYFLLTMADLDTTVIQANGNFLSITSKPYACNFRLLCITLGQCFDTFTFKYLQEQHHSEQIIKPKFTMHLTVTAHKFVGIIAYKNTLNKDLCLNIH